MTDELMSVGYKYIGGVINSKDLWYFRKLMIRAGKFKILVHTKELEVDPKD